MGRGRLIGGFHGVLSVPCKENRKYQLQKIIAKVSLVLYFSNLQTAERRRFKEITYGSVTVSGPTLAVRHEVKHPPAPDCKVRSDLRPRDLCGPCKLGFI